MENCEAGVCELHFGYTLDILHEFQTRKPPQGCCQARSPAQFRISKSARGVKIFKAESSRKMLKTCGCPRKS